MAGELGEPIVKRSAQAVSASAGVEEALFDVEEMSCASCVRRLEKALQAVPGVTDVTVNLASETAFVRYDPSQVQLSRIAEAGTAAGYPTQAQRGDAPPRAPSVVSVQEEGGVHVAASFAADRDALGSTGRALRDGQSDTLTGAAASVATSPGTGASLDTAPQANNAEAKAARKANEVAQQRRNLLLASFLTLPVFIVEMGGHLGIPGMQALTARLGATTVALIEAVLSTLVLFGPGRQFFSKGWLTLRRLSPDMNTLVAIGTGAAWGYSMLVSLRPDWFPEAARHLYFEAAAVIVVFILAGRYLEARAKGRTGDAIRALLALRPDTAHRIDAPGDSQQDASAHSDRHGATSIHDVPVSALVVGDAILIRPGERVPADSTLIDGTSYVDESMLTGEPMPVQKHLGGATDLTGGTVNGDGMLRARVTRIGAESTLSRIIAMVQRAQGAKLPIQQKVDRVTAIFVPVVLAIALLTFIAWAIWGPNLSFAIAAAVAVLIVACPCAMGLATPTSIIVGAGRAARLGVLFRQGDALQSLQACKIVAFDKTGTLTLGQPAVTDIHWSKEIDDTLLWERLGALETLSAHPLAHAVVASAVAMQTSPDARWPVVSDFVSETGLGVAGTIDGHRLSIGNLAWMARQCNLQAQENSGDASDDDCLLAVAAEWRSQMKTVLYVSINGGVIGALAVADPIRKEARAVVAALRAQRLRIAMITGDAIATAQAVAAELGIDEVCADVMPDGKVAAVNAIRKQYGTLAFVGDGMNDAPALAEADVGIAMGSGSDVAIESANVILSHGALHGVADAFTVSRATMRNIHQNLLWAFGYNVLLIPLAAGLAYPFFGTLLSPVLSAAAMALSSVFVLSNALRLRFVRSALPPAADTSLPGTRGG